VAAAVIGITLQAQAEREHIAHSSQEQPVSIVQIAQDVTDNIDPTEAHFSARPHHFDKKTETLWPAGW
jgi:hypothetical protein